MRGLIIGVALATTSSALAAYDASYDVYHAFTISVTPKPGQVYGGEWHWGNQTIAKNHTGGNDSKIDYSNLSFTNTGGSGFRQLNSSVSQASANANAQFQFNANGTGWHRAWGDIHLGFPNGQKAASYANSTVKVRIGTFGQNGTLYWSPTWHSDSISGNKYKIRDPVDVFTLNRLTGLTNSARLFDVEADLGDGGASSFADGIADIHGVNGVFRILMDDPGLVSPHGRLEIRFLNGIVEHSEGSGIWADLAPAPGTSGDLHLQLTGPNGFELQYNLGDPVLEGFDTDFVFDGGGGSESVVPEPSTLTAILAGSLLLFRRRRRGHA